MKEKIQQLIRYHAIKSWIVKYERLLMPTTLIAGVIFDSFTFATIDPKEAFVLLGFYLTMSAVMIAYRNVYDAKLVAPTGAFKKYLRVAAPFMIQFAFGGMLNATFIFYVFSGSLGVSWPFIGLVVLLMISNEVFCTQFQKPLVQLSVYYFILFALSSIMVPFFLRGMGARIFLLAEVVSFLLMTLYVVMFTKLVPTFRPKLRELGAVVASIIAVMNGLYFFNITPPIPLAVRDAVVAHSVKRVGTTYQLGVEHEPWYEHLIPGQTVHIVGSERVYLYTAVFAPDQLSTTIVHRWEYFDPVKKDWVTKDRLSFMISGGKQSGYRGFSFKSTLAPGDWRVNVETERGQVLGQVGFTVVTTTQPVAVDTVVK